MFTLKEISPLSSDYQSWLGSLSKAGWHPVTVLQSYQIVLCSYLMVRTDTLPSGRELSPWIRTTGVLTLLLELTANPTAEKPAFQF